MQSPNIDLFVFMFSDCTTEVFLPRDIINIESCNGFYKHHIVADKPQTPESCCLNL
jgi:hypothetical protein